MFLSKRKPWVSLLVLVLANILLISVQFRDPQGRLLLRSWTLLFFSPLASTLHLLTSGFKQVADRYLLLYDAREESRRLRVENARLRLELGRLRGLGEMVERTADLRRLQHQFDFDAVMASVIWKGAPFFSHKLLVNAGFQEGIRRGDPVITAQGIVGRVWVITPYSAEVELITNNGAAAGAMVDHDRLQGIVQGNGGPLLDLTFIPNYEDVQVGAILYTSGTDGIYPKNIPIGRVVGSAKGTLVYRDIVVEPMVDYSRLEEVLVLQRPPVAPSAQAEDQAGDQLAEPVP